MAENYQNVMTILRNMKNSGATKAELTSKASELGWTFDELENAYKAGQPMLPGVLGELTKNLPLAAAPLMQGVTLGYYDELMGLARSSFSDQSYDEARNYELAKLKRARSEAPIGSAVTEIAGAVVPAAAVAATGGAALGPAATSLGSIGRAATAGAVEGAVYGSGTADEGGRAEGALTGGLLGAGIGGGLQAGANALRGAYKIGVNAVAPAVAARNELRRAVDRDGLTPDQLRQNYDEARQVLGSEAMLVDAGGENVKGIAERLAITPGEGKEKIANALTQRAVGQLGRIVGSLRSLTGTRRTAHEAISQSIDAARANALPVKQTAMQYDPMNDMAVVNTFQQLARTPSGKKALKSAQEIAGNEGHEIDVAAPTMQDIDYFIRGLNHRIDGETTVRLNGQETLTPIGVSILKLKKRMLDPLDKANPDYAKFRSIWSGEESFQRAVKKGEHFDRLSSERLQSMFAGMSQSEQTAFRIGAIARLKDKMGNSAAKLPDFTRQLNSPNMREKILAILPAQSRDKWQKVLDVESGTSDVAQKALGNSRTAAREALRDDEELYAIDMIADLATGTGFATAARQFFGNALRKSKQTATLSGRKDSELARMLLSRGDVVKSLSEKPIDLGFATTVPSLQNRFAPGLTGLAVGGEDEMPSENEFPF